MGDVALSTISQQLLGELAGDTTSHLGGGGVRGQGVGEQHSKPEGAGCMVGACVGGQGKRVLHVEDRGQYLVRCEWAAGRDPRLTAVKDTHAFQPPPSHKLLIRLYTYNLNLNQNYLGTTHPPTCPT
jgi:hypothetical protein